MLFICSTCSSSIVKMINYELHEYLILFCTLSNYIIMISSKKKRITITYEILIFNLRDYIKYKTKVQLLNICVTINNVFVHTYQA